ncbi:MAG TPA: NrsF family protein [Polyangiaceae bacterium]
MRIAIGFGVAGAIALTKLALGLPGSQPFGPHIGPRLWHVVADGSVPSQDPPVSFVVTLELLWLLIALVATWFGATRGRSMLGRSAGSKVAVALFTPAALVVAWLAVASAWRSAVLSNAWLEAMTDDAARFHFGCALMSVVYAIGPLLALLAVRKHRDPVTPWQSGAAFGAVAGAWGAVVHLPFCSCVSPFHMVLGHVLPVVVLATVGGLVAHRVLALSPRAA